MKKTFGKKEAAPKPQKKFKANQESNLARKENLAPKDRKIDPKNLDSQAIAPKKEPLRGKKEGHPKPHFDPKKSPWPEGQELFPKPNLDIQKAIDSLLSVLEMVRPLNQNHQHSLAKDISDLSLILTTERAQLNYPYWSKPNFISAYLYYFLPWNLVRLTRLLAGLPRLEQALTSTDSDAPLILDLGSGPLTLPIALWLAYPNLRTKKLIIVAQDKAKQPIIWGEKILTGLAQINNLPQIWQISPINKPLEALPTIFSAKGWPAPTIISAANFLNELYNQRRNRTHTLSQAYVEAETDPEGQNINLVDCLDSFINSLAKISSLGDPQILVVEPGTRLGGKIIEELRQMALDADFRLQAPCTHQKKCPLKSRFGQRTWCHYTFSTLGAPNWLKNLSKQAGLTKTALSLAPLLLAQNRSHKTLKTSSDQDCISETVRVISSSFSVPGLLGQARYACSSCGLLLLENAGHLNSGDLLTITIDKMAQRDVKSGARIIRSS